MTDLKVEYDLKKFLPQSEVDYLTNKSDSKPSRLSRDVAAMSAEIPQWVWLASGCTLLLFSLYLYRTSK